MTRSSKDSSVKSQPLSIGRLNILCEETGSTHKALLLHAKVGLLAEGKLLA